MKTLDLGGLEKTVIAYSNLLADKLGSVQIYSFQGGLYEDNDFINGKVRTHKSRAKRLKPFLSIPGLLKLIKREKINVIIYHQRAFLPAIYAAKVLFPKICIIYKAHNVFNDALNRFIQADRYIAVTEEVKKDLVKSGKPANKISVITHGIRISEAAPRDNNIATIAYVGRFDKTKGIKTLLDAFSKVSKDHSINLMLRGAGNMEQEIRSYIAIGMMEPKINIHPPAIDDNEIYNSVDLLVLPSVSHEGFGLVLIEAMSRGIPVIAAKTGGIKNVITDGYNGLLFEAGNGDDLEMKLRQILDDVQLRNELVGNGMKAVAGKYKIENVMENYFKLLESL